MQEANLSDNHFNWTTGYGYNDIGREKVEEIYANVFGAEDALVRPIIVNGTHALSLCVQGLVRPGDEILSITSTPYDTLQGVIGIREEKGSLKEYGVTYDEVDFLENGDIDFNNVNFAYKKGSKKYVLQNIDLHIKSGETIGIIGGTGSSKSSLVNLISRLYDVSEGSVFVGGKDVRSYDIETLRNEVSVVLQKNVLFSGTIKENLRWGDKNATDEEIIRACELACANEFIDTLPNGYDTYIEQGGTNVSGGQKQRLCIARALLKKPKILILDDSTSAVDTATDAKIRTAFSKEIPNTTKIIIAQRISSVQDADKIIVLDDGKISGVGTHEELLENNEIYADVYNSQVKGDDDEYEVAK